MNWLMNASKHYFQTAWRALALLCGAAAALSAARAATVQTVFQTQGLAVRGLALDLRGQLVYYTAQDSGGLLGYYDEVTGINVIASQTFISPTALLLARGGVVVADSGSQQLLWHNLACDTNAVLAGYSPDGLPRWADGVGTNALLANPAALATNAAGDILFVDWSGLRKLDASNRVTTLATNFYKPAGVEVETNGDIWVADTLNHVIKKVVMSNGVAVVTIIAGQKGVSGFSDNLRAANALFNQPRGLRWIGGGTGLLVADSGNGAVRYVSYDAGCGCYSVGTIASTGLSNVVSVDLDNEGAILAACPAQSALKEVLRDSLPAPIILPASGAYSNDVTATFSEPALWSFYTDFHYTLDGSKPIRTDAGGDFVRLTNGGSQTVIVRCFSPDLMTSPAVSNTYSFYVSQPVIFPDGGSNNQPVVVSLTCDTAGAEMWYTTNGTTPSLANGTHYTGPFTLAWNCQIKARAFRDNFVSSDTASAQFDFYVLDPSILPAGSTNNNDIQITINSETPGAVVHYTTNGNFPTLADASYTGPFILSNTCSVRAKAFRIGFHDSGTARNDYAFVVSDPYIYPAGATNDNPVRVTVSTATDGAAIYYTLDGTIPTSKSFLESNGVPFWMTNSGLLMVKAFKDGYSPSTNISAAFSFYVQTPVVWPPGGSAINSNWVTMSIATSNALIRYTTDGAAPASSSLLYSVPVLITNTTTIRAAGFVDGFTSSSVITNTFEIQVDAPVMTPPGGFFPDGGTLTLSVQRPDAKVYYTTDGTVPSESSLLYTGPIRISQALFSGDLSSLKARAYAPNTTPSAVTTGENVSSNSVGVPREIAAGTGSTIILPIVANLTANQEVRSLQFRFEIVPISNAPALNADAISLLAISTNDFVPLGIGSADGNPVTNSYQTFTRGNTNGFEYYSSLDNLLINGYGMVANVKVVIPTNAVPGVDQYRVSLREVSGTSDAGQRIVSLSSLPDRALTVTNIHYMAGDIAVAAWYNAGDFGDGNLDNADANVVLKASLGVNTPPAFSDVYNAMDVYPETDGVIGDGMITYLDWLHVYLRSLRLETNNWTRYWMADGALGHSRVGGLAASQARALVANASVTEDSLWLRQALVSVASAGNLAPGDACSLPVAIKVLPGFSVAGLEFRAVVEPENGAPSAGAVAFEPAAGLAPPVSPGLQAVSQAACAWAVGAFSQPLEGSNLLGHVSFTIPAGAAAGQSYRVRLLCVDGAASLTEGLSLESASGFAWVSTPAPVQTHIVSDEWKTNFFGLSPGPEADPEADADGDGVPNWQEYLAGTNPTNAASRLEFRGAQARGGLIQFKWDAVPGRVYVIERSTNLSGDSWAPVQTNAFLSPETAGFTESILTQAPGFYRIKLQKQE